MVAIADPVRARIFFEILLHRKVTAKHLMKRLSISRSTLSYHLKKLEDDGILEVGISTEGRPSKQYSLCPEFSAPSFEAHVDESLDWLTWRSVWLQRTIVHLQAVVSIAMTGLEELNKAIQDNAESEQSVESPIDWMENTPYAYGYHRLTDEEASLWFRMVVEFVKEFEPKLEMKGNKRHLAFMGVLPLTGGPPGSNSSE